MSKVNLISDSWIQEKIEGFLKDYEAVDYYTVKVSHNIYVVDIKLTNYSVDEAKCVFDSFNQAVSYPYSALYVRFNEGKCVRYRYLTSKEDKEAFYCDLIIS